MKILIAPDSFKESLSSVEVSKYIKEGFERSNGNFDIKEIPLADGGEGTLNTLVNNLGGQIKEVEVSNPIGEPIKAKYGIAENKLAIIEMAEAAGLTLLDEEQRNPLFTSTYGVGELILDALDHGCRDFVIAIGGSSTNDGGVGMAGALGVEFLDVNGKSIKLTGKGLEELNSIDISKIDKRISESSFLIASDVNNVLCGPYGAAHVYGEQKGANLKEIKTLDANLKMYSEILKRDLNIDILNIPGSGAAGGLGGGLIAFLDSELKSGFEIISQKLDLENHIKKSEYIITGEGKIDSQTAHGKVPSGVGKIAKKYNKKVIAIAGSIGEDISQLDDCGITSIFSIIDRPMTLEEALNKETTKKSLIRLGEQLGRFIRKDQR